MSHFYDLTSGGLAAVINPLGTANAALLTASAAAETQIQNLRDTVIPGLVATEASISDSDYDAVMAYDAALRVNENSLLNNLKNGLQGSVKALDSYFLTNNGQKFREYVATDLTNRFLLGARGLAATVGGTVLSASTIVITNKGFGYAAGDALTITTSGGSGGTMTVATVDSYGGVLTVTVGSAGSGYSSGDTITGTVAPVMSTNFRTLYGQVQNDEFIYQLADRTNTSGTWAATANSVDVLTLDGNATLNVVVQQNVVSAYTVTITGTNATTGASATLTVGPIAAGTVSGKKLPVNQLFKLTGTVTVAVSGGSNTDRFTVTTV